MVASRRQEPNMRLILQVIRLRARIRIQVFHDLDEFHGLECALWLKAVCCSLSVSLNEDLRWPDT